MNQGKYGPGLAMRVCGTAGIVLIYVLLRFVPLPGVLPKAGMSVAQLGVSPYITASIIMELLAASVPSVSAMRESGWDGRRRFERITFVMSAVFSVAAAAQPVLSCAASGCLVYDGAFGYALPWVCLCAVSCLFSAAGLLIGRRLFGNGVSVLLCVSICMDLPAQLTASFWSVSVYGTQGIVLLAVGIVALAVLAVVLTCFKKNIGILLPGGASGTTVRGTLPIPALAGGVLPAVFAAYVLRVPDLICAFTGSVSDWMLLFDVSAWFDPDRLWLTAGLALWILLIMFFTGYSRNLSGGAFEISENMRRRGVVIPGVVPGKDTEAYLKKETSRMNRIGCAGICFAAVVPAVAGSVFGIPGLQSLGTSFLIIASVSKSLFSEFRACLPIHRYARRVRRSYGLLLDKNVKPAGEGEKWKG